jgi:hypothetical protein
MTILEIRRKICKEIGLTFEERRFKEHSKYLSTFSSLNVVNS